MFYLTSSITLKSTAQLRSESVSTTALGKRDAFPKQIMRLKLNLKTIRQKL